MLDQWFMKIGAHPSKRKSKACRIVFRFYWPASVFLTCSPIPEYWPKPVNDPINPAQATFMKGWEPFSLRL